MNPLKVLKEFDQAIWLDFVARGFIERGELRRLVDEDGIEAIAGPDEYDAAIKSTLSKGDRSVSDLYESLAVEDIQRAADLLRPVYEATRGADGFVSLEDAGPRLSAIPPPRPRLESFSRKAVTREQLKRDLNERRF